MLVILLNHCFFISECGDLLPFSYISDALIKFCNYQFMISDYLPKLYNGNTFYLRLLSCTPKPLLLFLYQGFLTTLFFLINTVSKPVKNGCEQAKFFKR